MTGYKSSCVVGITLALPLILGCPVRNLTIEPGFAFFEVQEAPAQKDVIGPSQVMIQATIVEVTQEELVADFFDPGSDPLGAAIAFAGVPIEQSPHVDGNLGKTDTLLEIMQQVDLPEIGSQVMVDVKFIEVSLASLTALGVTFDGGQNEELWDVIFTIDVNDQVPGYLNLVRTEANSGTASGQLPIVVDLTFVRQSDSAERTIEKSATLVLPQFDWSTVPDEVNWPGNGRTNLVPGLGRIPLLGNLFRRSQIEANDSELLIFITPTIINGDG